MMPPLLVALRRLALAGCACAAPHLPAQTAAFSPLTPQDVPRTTQMGGPPAPAGALGGGRYFPPVPVRPQLPTLWLIGDSTVRNGTLGDNGADGQWGWGAPLTAYFDAAKINVVNRAFGGTSSRSFYHGFFWPNLRPLLKRGDVVLMQFGANDNGGKGALKGTGEETQDAEGTSVHTFGWYLRQFVKETRERGAVPVICSLTPRKGLGPDGHFQRANSTHVAWAAAVAKEQDVPFVDLYEIIARQHEKLGAAQVEALYVPAPAEKLHPGWTGAVVDAECVIAGLKGLPANPLAPFLAPRGQAVAPAAP